MDHPEFAATSARYRRFAVEEAEGRSPLYAHLARSIADDPETIQFLLTVPAKKRQPNLLLAVVRHLFGTPEDWPRFRTLVRQHADTIRAAMRARSTQTNEPARCATLLPFLTRLPQPLALIEVGASAGLCLLPDFYAYDYGAGVLRPRAADRQPPVFCCTIDGTIPVPMRLPDIIWRAGLDLDPIDVSDPAQTSWLETLVWPEQTDRLARLRAAIAIAAAVKPRIVRGDLRTDLARLAAEAPRHATLVVFHTAVLAYVPSAADRRNFAREVRSLCPYWIANEGPEVFPDIARRAAMPGPRGGLLLSLNGIPVAWADAHGASLTGIGDPAVSPIRPV
jgi:hypothetical protein